MSTALVSSSISYVGSTSLTSRVTPCESVSRETRHIFFCSVFASYILLTDLALFPGLVSSIFMLIR
ncbi:hypothetical protein NA56DRAFT_383496 [Hyaloscypha hepaticicola]|uniref:Uncharacterized protein n=1 Tax=Hyaloscypha hepaticicola TaxID=2082293 RepID=A0A2J6QHG7_9HELO|nr:hypothetical protein NA56DRAFT_383496 [Hyaloscypha hepaticicola]